MAKHKSFKSFNTALKKQIAEIEKRSNDVSVKAAINAFRVATVTTPKDTGRAQQNWQLQNTLNTNSVDGSFTLNAFSKLSPPVYLVNNLPYILRLDNGYSAQAPAGITPAVLASFKRGV